MKCMSCEMEINPKWAHAIDMNICPFCGKSIFEEHLKNLFSVLRDTMNDLQSYPEQLNDWMLSNHNYIKTDAPNLATFLSAEHLKGLLKSTLKETDEFKKDNKFTVKVATEKGEEEILVEKIQSDEKTNDFFKRAEAVKPNIDGFKSVAGKTEYLKQLAKQIKQSGVAPGTVETEDVYQDQDGSLDGMTDDDFSSNQEISSSLTNYEDDEVPSVVLNMANKAKGGQSPTSAADLLKLQKMQDRLANSRRNFSGAKGSFSRS